MRAFIVVAALATLLVLPSAQPVHAAGRGPVATPSGAGGPVVAGVAAPADGKLSVGGTLTLQFNGLADWLKAGHGLPELVLYLDGQPLPYDKEHPAALGANSDQVQFPLAFTTASRPGWATLLGKQTAATRTVRIEVGLSDLHGYLGHAKDGAINATLVVYPAAQLWVAVIVLGIVALLLIWLGRTTDLLRDADPSDFGGATDRRGRPLRRTYSLAQLQMAWWFFLVLGTYFFLFMVTGQINVLSWQALGLMGIGAATALGATSIEKSKAGAAPAQLANPVSMSALQRFRNAAANLAGLRDQGVPDGALATLIQRQNGLASEVASKNLWMDILSDANGMTVHRFQAVVWSVVLGGIFLWQTYCTLQIPEFDNIMLATMAISNGTYLGFKIPEQAT